MIQTMFSLMLLALLGLASCNPDPEIPDVSYPLAYAFDKVTLPPARFYVLGQGNDYREIIASGSFKDFDQALSEEINIAPSEVFFLDSVVLLDGSRVRMRASKAFNPAQPAVEGTYQKQGKFLRVSVPNSLSLVLEEGSSVNALHWGMIGTIYTYLDAFSQETTLGPLQLEHSAFSGTTKIDSLLGAIRSKPGVRAGDTIAVSFPVGEYRLGH